ncbi:MAG: DUF1292 domain-containing protein [Clostridia bacterium]|nr:DUF1292 domain-containing protein [Clostridia bacterium]
MSDNKNPLEMILDEECDDNIVLFDEDGESTEFEQIAVIPLDDQLYCILRPVDMPELDEDEAFVFSISEDEEEGAIDLVEDDDIVEEVFQLYYTLLDDEE